MKRFSVNPRFDWENIVESQGLHYHHHDDKKNLYWNESAYYGFNLNQIVQIEKATNTIYGMYIQTVQHILDYGLLDKLGIPQKFHELIYKSWENDELSLYGRFDFWYDGVDLKLFEFNGDTPTSLFEAAVIQWEWLESVFPDKDQFNSIHDALIESWKYIFRYSKDPLHLACVKNHIEDYTTVTYLRDTAEQAGINTYFLNVDEIGWNSYDKEFRDTDENKIESLFKLYPWEWMINEEFGDNLHFSDTTFIEPIWKLVMSNKGILAIMYELFPDSEYLLPTYFEDKKHLLKSYVKKPIFSREGANIVIVENGSVTQKEDGDYGHEGFVYQELKKLTGHNDNGTVKYPVIGSWVVGGQACGMGIRESENLITNNGSSFIPHVII